MTQEGDKRNKSISTVVNKRKEIEKCARKKDRFTYYIRFYKWTIIPLTNEQNSHVSLSLTIELVKNTTLFDKCNLSCPHKKNEQTSDYIHKDSNISFKNLKPYVTNNLNLHVEKKEND
jgi:hypothetical protein